MDGIARTNHFNLRFQQRGLNPVVVDTLLRYGSARRLRGQAESLTFTKAVLAEIKTDLGDSVFKACERFKNTYIVASDDGVLITIARGYRRAVH
jgi:hypothetical protein